MWGALKSTASLLKSTLYDKFRGSLILKHNCKIHEFSMQIIRGTHAPFTKTYLVRLDFSQRWQVWSLSFLCFLAAESLKTSKSNYDHLFLPLVKIYLYQLVSKAIFKLERLFPLASLATGDCLAIHPPWFRGKNPTDGDLVLMNFAQIVSMAC